jgi:hypothetical protein
LLAERASAPKVEEMPSSSRSFFDGPTVRVAVYLREVATEAVVCITDLEMAESCGIRVKDLRQILRRLEAASMLHRGLLTPGRRAVPERRTVRLRSDALAWRGVDAWVDLYAAEDYVQHELGVVPGRSPAAA